MGVDPKQEATTQWRPIIGGGLRYWSSERSIDYGPVTCMFPVLVELRMVRAQSIKLPTEIMISVNECMKNDAVQSAPGIVNFSFATVRISMQNDASESENASENGEIQSKNGTPGILVS